MNFDCLKMILETISKCPLCSGDIASNCDVSKRFGLNLTIDISCVDESCGWVQSFQTSKGLARNDVSEPLRNRDRQSYPINNRFVLAMREIGKGFTGMEKFCGLMNMPPPMSKTTITEKIPEILNAYSSAAEASMLAAASEHQPDDVDSNTDVTDIGVSLDGTWQRRGYSSLNGVVTAISLETGKCVDFEVRSKSCKQCKSWEAMKTERPVEYNDFLEGHTDCSANHHGSASIMESEGAVEIFKRSEETRKLCYVSYLGDGDTNSFTKVVEAQPYGE